MTQVQDIDRHHRSYAAKWAVAAMSVDYPQTIGVCVRYKIWRSNKDKRLHLLCAEGAEAFEALPTAVRGMGPWTGGPEGAIDRLRLPFRVMLNQQGFTVVYAHVAQLELEMTLSLHAVPPANAECPQCNGDGHVPQHGGLRQRRAHGAAAAAGSRRWVDRSNDRKSHADLRSRQIRSRSPSRCRPIRLRGAVSGRCATIPENRRVPYREVVRGSRCRLAGADALMGQRLLELLGSLQTLATVASTWIEIVALQPRLSRRWPTA
jgi:hypothetical protein